VEFAGAISSQEIPQAFVELDVMALPSLTRKNWKEQFGRVLIEAMACGVPVVGSTSGELPNVIGDAGCLFAEGDAAALAEQLRRLWQQPDQRARLAAKGRERVAARYTQRRVAEATIALYHSLTPTGNGL